MPNANDVATRLKQENDALKRENAELRVRLSYGDEPPVPDFGDEPPVFEACEPAVESDEADETADEESVVEE